MVLLPDRMARHGIGVIEPCLPSPAKAPPAGPGWIPTKSSTTASALWRCGTPAMNRAKYRHTTGFI
jgi:hypothetical protein